MGVFSRFRRRKSEASTEEAAAATPSAESVEVVDGTDGAEETKAEEPVAGTATEAAAGSTAPEGVEIPKQQSADKAADNEAGEGARK
ncbi:hypothetical protein [Streptomyces sp. NPDC090022]|uniref:hypothetical protein n=1 Tax=Streptomyces sp. NPDC090022 TaxID=3365920 RepID=UPI0037FD95FB